MWIIAGLAGAAVGAIVGGQVKIETDQMWGLVQLKPSYSGLVAAAGVMGLVFADSAALWMGIGLWPPGQDPAIWAALLSGFLDGRGWRMAAKAVRSPHADLNLD